MRCYWWDYHCQERQSQFQILGSLQLNTRTQVTPFSHLRLPWMEHLIDRQGCPDPFEAKKFCLWMNFFFKFTYNFSQMSTGQLWCFWWYYHCQDRHSLFQTLETLQSNTRTQVTPFSPPRLPRMDHLTDKLECPFSFEGLETLPVDLDRKGAQNSIFKVLLLKFKKAAIILKFIWQKLIIQKKKTTR